MPKSSSHSVVVKSVDAAGVRRAVDDYAARLFASRADVEEVVVFGSFEKGNYAPGSDVDLLIVLSDSDKPIRDRIPDLLPRAFPIGVDIFPFTRSELAERAASSLMAAVRESRWRYRRTG